MLKTEVLSILTPGAGSCLPGAETGGRWLAEAEGNVNTLHELSGTHPVVLHQCCLFTTLPLVTFPALVRPPYHSSRPRRFLSRILFLILIRSTDVCVLAEECFFVKEIQSNTMIWCKFLFMSDTDRAIDKIVLYFTYEWFQTIAFGGKTLKRKKQNKVD